MFPAEVERALTDHPSITEAAVVATGDEPADQVGVAYVVLAEGAQASEHELLAHCRERLAACKVPAAIHFREALPKNAAGKVIKDRLRGGAATAWPDRPSGRSDATAWRPGRAGDAQ